MTAAELLRRETLTHLIDDARAAVRGAEAMLKRMEFLAEHGDGATERVDCAKLAIDWEKELEASRVALAALEAERDGIDGKETP